MRMSTMDLLLFFSFFDLSDLSPFLSLSFFLCCSPNFSFFSFSPFSESLLRGFEVDFCGLETREAEI